MLNFPIKPKMYLGPLVVLLISFLLFALEPHSHTLFVYDRNLISQHELWRLLSANFLHTNFNHLLLNSVGLILLWALHGYYYTPARYAVIFIFCSLLTTMGMYLLVDNLMWYVGLSGTLHGLFVWGAFQDIRQKMRTGWLLMIGVWGKIVFEQLSGPSLDVAKLIDANVAIEAHLFGAIGGLLCIVLYLKMDNNKKPG